MCVVEVVVTTEGEVVDAETGVTGNEEVEEEGEVDWAAATVEPEDEDDNGEAAAGGLTAGGAVMGACATDGRAMCGDEGTDRGLGSGVDSSESPVKEGGGSGVATRGGGGTAAVASGAAMTADTADAEAVAGVEDDARKEEGGAATGTDTGEGVETTDGGGGLGMVRLARIMRPVG